MSYNKSIEEIADLNQKRSSVTNKVAIKPQKPADKLFLSEIIGVLFLTATLVFYFATEFFASIFIVFWLSYAYILASALIRKKRLKKIVHWKDLLLSEFHKSHFQPFAHFTL